MSTAREYLRVTPELVPGTFDATGTAVLIDIDNANAYTARKTPMQQELRTASSYNRRGAIISKKYQVNGNLTWNVRGTQAALLVAWCMPVSNVLKSYTIDHVFEMEDTGATHLFSRHLGMYVQQAQLSAGESDQWFKAALTLVGLTTSVITVTDFPEPALTDYPTDAFLTFEDASAGLTLHAATRVDLDSFQITIKNLLDIKYFVAASPQKIKWCGSDIDWTAKLSYLASVPRADFEATTPIVGGITFNNGVHSLVMNMHSQNYYASITDALDMSKVYMQDIAMKCFLDRTAATDFSMTST